MTHFVKMDKKIPQQVFLIHATCGMHVGVHFSNVIEVTMGNRFLCGEFTNFVEKHVQLKFVTQIRQTTVAE